MTPEEHDRFIVLEHAAAEQEERHKGCTMPMRMMALEKHQTRVETGIAILIFLVGSGRVVDLVYVVMHWSPVSTIKLTAFLSTLTHILR